MEPEFDSSDRNGARMSPFAFDSPTAIQFESFGDADNSNWTVSFSSPTDITAAVLAENQFNEAPPEGAIFAGFNVSLTLDSADVEPLSPSFNLEFEVTGGATAGVYDQFTLDSNSIGCGLVANQFDEFSEVFAGGTLTGTICIPIPAEDLDHPNTRVAIKFAEDSRVYFG